MSYLIVSDSSSNLFDDGTDNYRTVPLHFMIDGTEWSDTPDIDMDEFNTALDSASSPVTTSCPSVAEWHEAFGDEEEIYCFTISRNLSGSYAAAIAAKHQYEEEHPARHVYVIDSLATGPTMVIEMSMLGELIGQGIRGEEALEKIDEYRHHRHALLFTLQSVKRLADNGRVSPLLVKAIGVLDVRLVGEASQQGTIKIAGQARGAAKVLHATYKHMLRLGYNGGRIVIAHNQNKRDAEELIRLAKEQFGAGVESFIHETTALCSFYAEKYGYIVGFDIDEQAARHLLPV